MSARGFGTLSALPLAIAALLNASVGAAQQAGTVEGRVTDAHTGEPLSGVLIEATGAEGPVISDRQGRWRLQLTPGSHRLTASFIGYAEESREIDVGRGGRVEIAMTRRALPLDAVVVTASRRVQRLADAPIATELISRAEIIATGGSDVAQVLSERLGVHLESGPPGGEGAMLQGLSSERVLVLVDGQPLVGRIGGTLDVTRVPTSAIERIEVVKGSQSSLYGSEAMGGVINIITRSAPPGQVRGSVAVTTGTQGRLDGSGTIGGAAGGVEYLADIGRRSIEYTPGFSSAPGAEAERWDGLVKLGWSPSSEVKMEVSGLSIDESQRWRSGPLYTFSDNRQTNGRLALEWSRGRHRLAPSISYSGFEHLSRQATSPRPVDGSGDLENQRLLEGEVMYGVELDRFTLDLGVEAKREHIESDRVEGGERTMDTVEPFAQATIGGGALRLIPGARLTVSEEWGNRFTPRAALMYRPVPELALRASVGQGYRAPSFKELGMEFLNASPGGGYRIRGNPDLKPETSRNLSADIEWAPGASYLRVSAFHNRFDDFIETQLAAEEDGVVVYTYQNVADGFTRGLEVEAGWAARGFRVEGGYALLDTGEGASGAPLLGRPKHSARFTTEQPPVFGFRTLLSAVYTGETPIQRTEEGIVSRESYLRLDARVARRLPGGFELAIGGRNLLDSAPDGWSGFNDRHLYVGLTWAAGAN